MPENKGDFISGLKQIFRKREEPKKETVAPAQAFEMFLTRINGDKDNGVSNVGRVISGTVKDMTVSCNRSAGTVEQFLENLNWNVFERDILFRSLLLPIGLWRGWIYKEYEMNNVNEPRSGVGNFLPDLLVGAPKEQALNVSFKRNSRKDTSFVFAIRGQYGGGSKTTGRTAMEGYRSELQPEKEKTSGVRIWMRKEVHTGMDSDNFVGEGDVVGVAVEIPIDTLAEVIRQHSANKKN